MVKRFPVLYPMPFNKKQYLQYIEIAKEPIESIDYFKKTREIILPENIRVCEKHKTQGIKSPVEGCIDCYSYGKEMLNRTINNLIATGFIEKNGKYIILPQHSLDYLNKTINNCFAELVMKSLEYAWGKPDGNQIAVEAILDILNKLPKNNENFISQKNLLIRLSKDKYPINGYDVGNVNTDRSLREILKLLDYLNTTVSDGGGKYKLTSFDKVEKIKRRFRKISYLNIAERAIDILGPKHEALDKDFIMALSKYYIYRHSGGIGRQKELIKILFKKMEKTHYVLLNDYYKKDAKRYKFGASRGENIENTIKNYRNKLAREIAKKCKINTEENLFKHHLSRLKVSQLKGLEQYKSEDEIKDVIRRSKGRFDRSILDLIKHDNREFQFPNKFQFFSTWQEVSVDNWGKDIPEKNHKAFTGIVSAVTGSGKTIMALLAIQHYVNKNSNAIVSIIVPTKVLMYQWAKECAKILGLSSSQIGLRGDGFKDSFSEGKRIVISIVNSAIRDDYLKKDIESVPKSIKHLLIADECHRYGGIIFNRVFNCRIDAKLGLSATPPAKKNDFDKPNFKSENNENNIIESLGNEFYQLNYNKARELNLICEFKIKYVAVKLTTIRRLEYDALTKLIAKSLDKIRLRYGHRLDAMKFDTLHQKLQIILKNDEHPDPSISNFFRLTKKRRDIVNDAYQKKSCFFNLIKNNLNVDEKSRKKIMIFHEKISQLEDIISRDRRVESDDNERNINTKLENMLYTDYYRPVIYHSLQDSKWNRWAMEWFRKDIANTMISVKALVEGVDVPSADLGIVRISSSSVRQRIQTIGRVLRKGRDKSAEIFVLFVKNTVDENIFKEYNWEEELGLAAIEYYDWDEINKKLITRDIKDLPQPITYEDNVLPLEVDVSNLNPGDIYLGRYAGDMYHVSADGKPYKRTRNGRVFINNNDVIKAGQLIKKLKGGGKFLITPQGNIITKIKGQGTLFLGSSNTEDIRNEAHQKIKSFNKSLKKKRCFKKPPTFEELFGS